MQTQIDNTENNILIADFLGFRKVKVVTDETGKYYNYQMPTNLTLIKEQEIEIESEWGWGLVEQSYIFSEDLIFHSDWNWLIESVHKCLEIINEDMLNEWEQSFSDAFFSMDIVQMYDEVVAFIKWYNETKTK